MVEFCFLRNPVNFIAVSAAEDDRRGYQGRSWGNLRNHTEYDLARALATDYVVRAGVEPRRLLMGILVRGFLITISSWCYDTRTSGPLDALGLKVKRGGSGGLRPAGAPQITG